MSASAVVESPDHAAWGLEQPRLGLSLGGAHGPDHVTRQREWVELAETLGLHSVWLPEMLPVTPEIVFYGASLIVSTGTLLLSAVPAAIAERLGVSPDGALRVWFWSALAITALGVGSRLG